MGSSPKGNNVMINSDNQSVVASITYRARQGLPVSSDAFYICSDWSTLKIWRSEQAHWEVFLTRREKTQVSTIGTYLTAISTVLRRTIDNSPAQSPELQAMVRSFRIGDQKKMFRPPQWDLNIILKFLSSGVCEPRDDNSFEMLTIKTVFLVGMATAARVSEIHAIDSTHVSFDDGMSGVAHINLALDLVTKNHTILVEVSYPQVLRRGGCPALTWA